MSEGEVELEVLGTPRDVEMMVVDDDDDEDYDSDDGNAAAEAQEDSASEPCRLRGRPFKGSVPSKPRTRESIRLKNSKPVISGKTAEKMQYEWPMEEKLLLLKGLQEVGDKANLLKKFLPGRTTDQIRSQLRMWKMFALQEVKQKSEYDQKRMGKPSRTDNLEKWLRHIEDLNLEQSPRLFALSKVFLLISEYGRFPPPEENDGVDFRAMYRYIHCMLNGIPMYGTNQQTARVINHCLYGLSQMMRKQHLTPALQTILSMASGHMLPSVHTYSRTSLPPTRRVANLWSHRDTNPLNLPPTFFEGAVVDESDEDDD